MIPGNLFGVFFIISLCSSAVILGLFILLFIKNKYLQKVNLILISSSFNCDLYSVL